MEEEDILPDKFGFVMMTFDKPYIQKGFKNEDDAWTAAKLFGGVVFCYYDTKMIYSMWYNGVNVSEATAKKTKKKKVGNDLWEI